MIATASRVLCCTLVAWAPLNPSLAKDSEGEMTHEEASISGINDFDFLIGQWNVHHRRLKERLVQNHEWVEFEGSTIAQKIMGGYGNIDDNVIDFPGGLYHAVSLRSFDPKTHLWSIWWLDGRSPQGPLEAPVKGGFRNGVGTFYADDMLDGRPIRVRFLWSDITRTSARWAQAFSGNAGKTWETNWTMDFVRVK